MRSVNPRAAVLIDRLGLEPYPEGGYFREIYHSPSTVQGDDQRPTRGAMTSIYFLVVEGQHSRWHKVASDELWHFYEGAPLEILLAPPSLQRAEHLVLGPPLGRGHAVHSVPAGWWQAARPQGAYSLVGCTVAPGFELVDFAFLRDDSHLLSLLQGLAPELAALA